MYSVSLQSSYSTQWFVNPNKSTYGTGWSLLVDKGTSKLVVSLCDLKWLIKDWCQM